MHFLFTKTTSANDKPKSGSWNFQQFCTINRFKKLVTKTNTFNLYNYWTNYLAKPLNWAGGSMHSCRFTERVLEKPYIST